MTPPAAQTPLSPRDATAQRLPLHIALVCNTAWAIYTYRQGLLSALTASGARVTVIAGGPHAIICTHADEGNQALLDFIGRPGQVG